MPNSETSRRCILASAVAGGAMLLASRACAGARLAVGGTGAALGTVKRLAEAFSAQTSGVELHLPASLGTTGGMRAVLAGAIDIAVGVRPVTAEEAAVGARSQIFARSPFGFVTSHPRPPTDLRAADLPDIYAGTRRTWPDGSPIRVVLRTRRDGDSLFLIERFPETARAMDESHERKLMPVAQTDQINLDIAERLEGSFTSSTMAAVASERRTRLRPLLLDGVEPTAAAVASGAYPHVRPLYFITMPTTGEAGHAFVAFVRSPAGAAILADCACLPA